MGDGSLGQTGIEREASVERELEIGDHAIPRRLVAERIGDAKACERATRLARVRHRVQHVEALEREHARDSAEHAGTVGGHHRQLVAVDLDVLTSGFQSRELRRRRKFLDRGRAGKVGAQAARHSNDERIDQLGLPRTPCGRPGRPTVGFRERGEQPQSVDGADRGDDPIDRGGIVEVAPRGDVGQQQVVLDQGDDDVEVVVVETDAPADPLGQDHARSRVIARLALAEVVQQRRENEQIGAQHEIGALGRVGDGLEHVTVDGEPVIRVALRPSAHRRPLREDARPDAALIEGLDDGNRPAAGQEQFDEQPTRRRGPWLGRRLGLGREPLERRPLDGRAVRRGRERDAQREVWGGRVDGLVETHLAIEQRDLRRDGVTASGASP